MTFFSSSQKHEKNEPCCYCPCTINTVNLDVKVLVDELADLNQVADLI